MYFSCFGGFYDLQLYTGNVMTHHIWHNTYTIYKTVFKAWIFCDVTYIFEAPHTALEEKEETENVKLQQQKIFANCLRFQYLW